MKKFDFSKKDTWKIMIRNKHHIPNKAKVFIFIGRITRDKGLNELFKATKRLVTERLGVYLLLVGSEE